MPLDGLRRSFVTAVCNRRSARLHRRATAGLKAGVTTSAMPTPPPPARVDDLRDRLRALGYLDAGVNRFVLAPASGSRSALAIALRSSLRIGLLGGVLLGPAAAIGISLRLPGLVTGPRDAMVVAVYLAALFGLTIAAAAFVAAEIARRLVVPTGRAAARAGRARSVVAASGLAVGGICLSYLTLWWRTANAGFAWNAPAWTVFALGVAVAISLLLGHAVTMTALALIARTAEPGSLAPRARRSFWRMSGPLGLLAFAGAAVALISTTPSGPAAGSMAPEFAVVPTGLRVTVVAIDGVDVTLADRLTSSGALPALAALTRGQRVRLQPSDTSDPARLWTTIATGQPAERHGVSGLETRRVAGVQGAVPASRSPLVAGLAAATDLLRLTRPALASDDQRREKTFWEVAGEKGLRTAVVNWWASWPAPQTAGSVITDRAVLRLERGGAQDAEIAPPELYEPLRAGYPAMSAAARDRARSAFAGTADADVRAVLQRSAELDGLLAELARHPALGPLDLRVVYLPGLDIAQHALLTGPGESTPPPSRIAERVRALETYYRFLDGLLASLAPLDTDRASPDQLVVVVAQPGRVSTRGEGLLTLSGQAVRDDLRASVAATSVAPTLLYALGLPVSRELNGRALTEFFDEAFTARYPVREIDRYGSRLLGPPVRRGQPLDEEMIERMRSLGYVR